MPRAPVRQLSYGEKQAKRRVNRHKPPPKSHIRDTAKAWGIEYEEMLKIWRWVEDKVPPHQRWRALITILRRKYK